MKKVIKVKLSEQGIQQAINEIKQYEEDLKKKAMLVVEQLVAEGILVSKAKVKEYGIIHDTKLSSSIHGMIVDNKGFIRVDDKYAVFFEFGTGPVGAKKPHPLQPTYTKDGWFTKADGKPMDLLYRWNYITNENGDKVYFTKGQKAKPFMYDTAQELREKFYEIVRKVFQ